MILEKFRGEEGLFFRKCTIYEEKGLDFDGARKHNEKLLLAGLKELRIKWKL
jgi:hypothetical protein